MVKGKIGFVQEAPTDKVREKTSREQRIGNVTVIYSTEAADGVGFYHNCDIKRGDVDHTRRMTTVWTTERLTLDEVERRFALAPGVSEYISEVSGGTGRTRTATPTGA